MNWLLLIVIILLLAYISIGYHKGMIRTIISMFAVIIALVVAAMVSPYLSSILQKTDGIYNYIEKNVNHAISIDDAVSEKTDQLATINELPLPDSIKESLTINNNKEIYNLLHIDSFDDYIAAYITCMILRAISFSVVFIIALILIRIITQVLDLVSKLPIVNGLNKLGGAVIGLSQGLIILWVLCIVLTMFGGTELGMYLFEQINDSQLLSTIYNNNVLMQYIINILQGMF